MMRAKVLWFCLLAVIAAPTPAAFRGARADEAVSGPVSAGAIAYREVNARRSSPEFRSYIGAALEYLKDHPTRIGRLTFESIRDGYVRVDELRDLTSWDFWRVSRSLARWGIELRNDDYFLLRRPQSGVARRIESVIDANVWGNRIYVARGFGREDLANSLVHEVNHVLNDVDRDYYDRWPVNAFLHEYRAFFAEKMFDPSRYEGVHLAGYVIDIYGFKRSEIPESVLEQPLTGLLFPTGDAWSDRDVESDPVDDRWLSPVYGDHLSPPTFPPCQNPGDVTQ
jgi:hypothetical protein